MPAVFEETDFSENENICVEEFNDIQTVNSADNMDMDIESEGSNADDSDYVVDPIEAESLQLEESGLYNQLPQKDITDDSLKRTRSTKYAVDKKTWADNKNRGNRERGESYLGKKKENGTWKYNLLKQPRTLQVSCNCKLSKNKSTLQCRKLEEVERNDIFKRFWEFTWKEKKVFVKSHVSVYQTVRKRSDNENSRRSYSNKFYLGRQRFRVCKTMFLNTLGVKDWVIKNWAKSDMEINQLRNSVGGKQTQDLRIKSLHEFFDSLPKLESHYCRASTSKLYLEPIWTYKSQLYKLYKTEFCTKRGENCLSIATFLKEFDNKRLSLYRPKKDLCDICVSFETGNLTEEKYNEHVQMKKEARDEKSKDKESTNEVLTMDLQSVLLCPKSNVSSLYFKTKLIVHNFTIFDVKRYQGYCYLWNESEGGVTSNEFTTIIIHFLESYLELYPVEGDKEIIIYSDGCGYQNRNSTLSNALFNCALQKNVTIIQKYLQKGHTQMEVDSVHSVIEKQMRNKKINVPADYVHICKTACQKTPYKVEYLQHNFFKKCDEIKNFNSIRPGKTSGSPVVNDLKALKYSSNGVFYKLRHPHDWQLLPIRLNVSKVAPVDFKNLPQLHKNRLKIKTEKYKHLQELKKSIELDYHDFYDKLPHE